MAHFRRRAFGFEGGQIVTMDGETHDVGNWDLLIAHPPCTYLSNAGARHLWKNHQLQEDRVIKGILGRDLFMRFWWADIPKICVENPIPSRVFALPKYTQSIQPYQFGHPFTKKTCLWLKGLSPLEPTDVVEPTATWCPSGSYSHKHGEQHKGMFTTDRARNRAKTFPGIATAMQAAKVSEVTGAPLPKPLTWKRGFYDTTRTFPSGWYECPVCGCRVDWEPVQCPKCYTRLELEETDG